MKKIAVGISGGVDSSVSALLLKKAGFDVIGVFMTNWDAYLNNDFENNFQKGFFGCDSWVDFQIARTVCQQLNIPLYRVEFIKEYWNEVFLPFLKAYQKGQTPNPDILCNQRIKFGYFLDYCLKQLNCDLIATGHYAGVKKNSKGIYQLLEAKDPFKDQTYFLCNLNQSQLAKVIFPLFKILKKEVRQIAKFYQLTTWNRKDSTGICFIGERNFPTFLKNYLPQKQGDIIDFDTKQVLGQHEGIFLYTIGQRKGLHLSGNQSTYFVCGKDWKKNILYVTDKINQKKNLYSQKCNVEKFNWIGLIPNNSQVEIRFRHTPIKVNGFFEIQENGLVNLFYPTGYKAVTEGQYAVLYQNKVCLGGGIISQVFYNRD